MSDEIMAAESVRGHDMSMHLDLGLFLVRRRDCLTGAAPPANLRSIHAEGKVLHCSFALDLQDYRVVEFDAL